MGFLGKIGGALGGLVNPTVALGTFLEGGMSFVGTKYGSDLQGHENDRMRQYNLDMSREMFNKQVTENRDVFERNIKREDEVWSREKAYNEDLWNKMNEYNSPASQMQRLKDAGLNPNLMYGQGTTGIATAIKAAEVSPAGAEAARVTVPEYGPPVPKGEYVMGALRNYVAIRNANLMAQNMSQQNDLLEAQERRVNAETRRTNEEAKSVARENKLLEGTGTSKSDPGYYKVLRRIADDTDTSFWKGLGGRLKAGYLNWLEEGGLERDTNEGWRLRQERYKRRPIADENKKMPLPRGVR